MQKPNENSPGFIPPSGAAEPPLISSILEAATDSIIIIDLGGHITFANPAAERLLGLERAQIVGRVYCDPIWNLSWLDGTLIADEERPFWRVARSGQPVTNIAYVITRPDGSRSTLTVDASPVHNEMGELASVLVMVRDVTEQRQMEAALSRSQATLQAILNSGDQSIMLIGRDYRLQHVNANAAKRCLDLFGFELKPGDSIYRAVNPDDVESFNQHFTATLAGQTVRTERALRGSGDRVHWYEIQYNPFYDQHGEITAVVMTSLRIGDRKAAECRLQFLAEVSDTLSSSLDFQTTLTTVSRLAIPRLGDHCMVTIVEDDGTIARLSIAHVDPKKEELAREIERRWAIRPLRGVGVVQVLETQQSNFTPVFSDELHRLIANNDEHLELLRQLTYRSYICVPMVARGRAIGTISLFRTETGDPYTEQDLALAEELGRRAASAVDNARLYRDMTESVRIREEFLSIASHELRTPLTTVHGYVQLLSRQFGRPDVDETQIRNTMRHLAGQVERFGELVSELLDLSRIQRGRMELNLRQFDLVQLAYEVYDRFEHFVDRTPQHEMLFDADGTVMGVWDESRIDQVLTNLLSNALKYSPHGGAIRVSVQQRDSWAEIAVEDEGIGVTESDQEILFRPFSRGEVASGTATGVGLGLHISAQIVQHHGGTITVESEPGKGSRFCVRLPLFGDNGNVPSV